MTQRGQQPDGRNVATAIAFVGLMLTGLGLFALVGMIVMPAITKVILFIAAMVGIGILQYVCWGWKLDRDRIQDDDDSPRPDSH